MSQKPTTSWLVRLLTWDGVLPGVTWSLPFLVKLLLPNSRGAIELIAIVVPIVAFFARYGVGTYYITTNECGPTTRRIQKIAFGAGIFVLVVIDAVLVLAHVMPAGALFTTTTDIIVWIVLYTIYVAAMAVAMYPGRAATAALTERKLRDTEERLSRSRLRTVPPPPRRDPR